MSVWRRVFNSNFSIRLRSWEYWPFGIIQFPVFIYFSWLAIKARSVVFFSACNPGILMGGMFGESKFEVLKRIPCQYVPKTILIQYPTTLADLILILNKNNLGFPVIFKPELGERGFGVKRINNEADVTTYLNTMRVNFLVQEFIDLPLEFGVFYTRFPTEACGKVTSVTMKEMLAVTGDGKSTLQQLIMQKPRAKLQWKNLQATHESRLHQVIPDGEKVELVSIGNHALGTMFLDGCHLINDQLNRSFDYISKQIDGFYFGRFDLRCRSVEDLYAGNVIIMELNGCGAEPAHIYQPGFSMWKAIAVMFAHWHNIYQISIENHRTGVRFLSFREGYHVYKHFKAATS